MIDATKRSVGRLKIVKIDIPIAKLIANIGKLQWESTFQVGTKNVALVVITCSKLINK